MSSVPTHRIESFDAVYARLAALPENLVGEILDGVLHTQPRPAGPPARTRSPNQRSISTSAGRSTEAAAAPAAGGS